MDDGLSPAKSNARSIGATATAPSSTVTSRAESVTTTSRTGTAVRATDSARANSPATPNASVITSPEIRALSASGVSSATIFPSSITRTRSASASASSR
jgi:hypothetical protein